MSMEQQLERIADALENLVASKANKTQEVAEEAPATKKKTKRKSSKKKEEASAAPAPTTPPAQNTPDPGVDMLGPDPLAAAAAPVVQPKAAAQPPAQTEETYTLDDVKAQLIAAAQKAGDEPVRAVLTKFGVQRVSELAPTHFSNIMAHFQVLLDA